MLSSLGKNLLWAIVNFDCSLQEFKTERPHFAFYFKVADFKGLPIDVEIS
jgi:hypothetical protein